MIEKYKPRISFALQVYDGDTAMKNGLFVSLSVKPRLSTEEFKRSQEQASEWRKTLEALRAVDHVKQISEMFDNIKKGNK